MCIRDSLWDDRLRVAFNYSGKGSAVDMELVMDAEALAGPEGRFVLAPPASTKKKTAEPQGFGGFLFVLHGICARFPLVPTCGFVIVGSNLAGIFTRNYIRISYKSFGKAWKSD